MERKTNGWRGRREERGGRRRGRKGDEKVLIFKFWINALDESIQQITDSGISG